MVELLLKRYLWLIDTLKRGGEMTFDEISAKWDKSSVNDNQSELTKRTFYNHCQAVARHFGIDIECRRGRGLNLYYITNPEAIEENSLTKQGNRIKKRGRLTTLELPGSWHTCIFKHRCSCMSIAL